ncbi:hypothetical protein [Carboxylicivirga taeanensis]|uniref:hypothetical protein n=1 Tax=Carboxylicivirga taeanensis TaxID=1416875 RepID=UPI003F6DB311
MNKEILKEIREGKYNQSVRLFFWYVCLIIGGYFTFRLQRIFLVEQSEYKEILTTTISITSITTAIIISFLFSKLSSERTERIVRKQKIDFYSKKLTSLRKIAHFLRSSSSFWTWNNNIKKFLDNKYKDLTLSDYDNKEYNWHEAYNKETKIGELPTQAYLGLKELENGVSTSYKFYDSFFRHNYTVNELAKIHDACERIWSFFDTYKRSIRDVSSLHQTETKHIKENLNIINPNFNNSEFNNEAIINLFDIFPQNYIQEHFQLTQLNNRILGANFVRLLLDLVVFILISLCGILILSIKMNVFCKLCLTNILTSIFVVVSVDLIVSVILTIKNEIKVNEFYNE